MKSSPFIVLCFSLFVAGELTGQGKNYYVSKSGDDSRDGLSIQTAWRSLDKISNFDFNPGDSLMLEGGVEFKGTITPASCCNEWRQIRMMKNRHDLLVLYLTNNLAISGLEIPLWKR